MINALSPIKCTVKHVLMNSVIFLFTAMTTASSATSSQCIIELSTNSKEIISCARNDILHHMQEINIDDEGKIYANNIRLIYLGKTLCFSNVNKKEFNCHILTEEKGAYHDYEVLYIGGNFGFTKYFTYDNFIAKEHYEYIKSGLLGGKEEWQILQQ